MASSSSGTGIQNTFKQFDIVEDFSDHKLKSSTPFEPLYSPQRIMREWKILEKNLPESIYVRVYEGRIDLLRALIVGPPRTPYHDGLFVFDFKFPTHYPNSPPMAYYHSFGYHLNRTLHSSGRVCLSLLNTWDGHGPMSERWSTSNSGGSTMLQVLVSIQGLVLRPYGEGKVTNEEINLSNYKAFLQSCKTMVCLVLKNPPLHFRGFISDHFHKRGMFLRRALMAYHSNRAEVGYYSDDDNDDDKAWLLSTDQHLSQKIDDDPLYEHTVYRLLKHAFAKNEKDLLKVCAQKT